MRADRGLGVLVVVGLSACKPSCPADASYVFGECMPIHHDAPEPLTLEAEPCPPDFPETSFGGSSSVTMELHNPGTRDVHVAEILVSAPFSTDLSSATVAAGSSVPLIVTFTPIDGGTAQRWLEIRSDAEAPARCWLTANVPSETTDFDGDGFVGVLGGGDDCDDEDAAIHPGAGEIWYDGIDEDCDGADDFDQDFDGYESDAYNPDASAGGGDCQDRKAAINPGETETYYDGVDGNCDGRDDYDADDDGVKSAAYGGGDCDDLDAAITTC